MNIRIHAKLNVILTMIVIGISLLKDCNGNEGYHDESVKELCHSDILGMKIDIKLTVFISEDCIMIFYTLKMNTYHVMVIIFHSRILPE